jgi:hypothetical protein
MTADVVNGRNGRYEEYGEMHSRITTERDVAVNALS